MLRALLLASALTFAVAGAASAKEVKLHAMLSGAQEVPAHDVKGSGEATATLDTAAKTLTYDVSFKDLTGPATMAHFHGPAAAGANAGVLVGLGNNPTSPIKGKATLTDDQMKAFLDGKVYVNVHTAANPGGELRGQMTAGK